MVKLLDWNAKQTYAKTLTIAQLMYAIKDCLEAAKAGIDEGYYHDEASVYRTELNLRRA